MKKYSELHKSVEKLLNIENEEYDRNEIHLINDIVLFAEENGINYCLIKKCVEDKKEVFQNQAILEKG